MNSIPKRKFVTAIALPAFLLTEGAYAQEATTHSGSSFDFYGQINMGYLGYNDGAVSESYFPVDNDNSGTRIGLFYDNTLNSGWTVDGRFELGITPKSTSQVNLNNPNDAGYQIEKKDLRHLEIAFSDDRSGTIAFGQGSMSTDAITSSDFSGTNVVASVAVRDSAGGQLLRGVDGTLNGEQIKGHFTDLDGGRLFRLRYDTPNYSGFTFAASYGQNVLNDDDKNDYYDISGRYVADTGDYMFKAGIGYSWNGEKPDIFAGSAAVLHKSTGLNLAIASGASKDAGSYGYIKAGISRDFVTVGATAFSLDYYSGADVASDGAESNSMGFAVVQNFDEQNLELYGTIRQYKTKEPTVSYQDSEAFLAGLRFKF